MTPRDSQLTPRGSRHRGARHRGAPRKDELTPRGSGLGSLAVFGLPPRRLPLADLAETFRLLAVALVPAPRLVLAAAPFAHARRGAVGAFWPGNETFV